MSATSLCASCPARAFENVLATGAVGSAAWAVARVSAPATSAAALMPASAAFGLDMRRLCLN
jgi:hypothetical protein